MSNSLKDQLLGLGYKAAPPPERKPEVRDGTTGRRDASQRDSNRRDSKQHDPKQRDTRKPDARNRSDARPASARPGSKPADAARPRDASRPSSARGPRPSAPRRDQAEIDLGKAYAIRAQKEKDERIEAERLKQEEAKQRREAKAKLAELLAGKALNDPAAEIVRHFEYGGKIKRVYVNAEQLKALNVGELGVVQDGGRYLIVSAAVLAEAETIFAQAVALKVDPNAPATDDPYSDPAYQVPDDLVW
ncbi:MAG TPA: DUF2058 family protein [Arenimonas sp.]|uniref:DUF2058 domain-containing protein n=1 Tax=Arenimonas sp. TaxID=1872635 RepID=UPI002CEE5974|nr:DUF2058 family protein [Arenimonas sp.]HMB56388.1 DUF2058 family protein [Arenimonas sp.]